MTSAVSEQFYDYHFSSAIQRVDSCRRVALSISGGDAQAGTLYSGSVERPHLAAQLLLAVGSVAATRYFTPPGMLARITAAADPVISSDGSRLRFESLSQCAGVYARADFEPDSLGAVPSARGTTNVDFNAPMRASLAQVRDDDLTELVVSRDAFELHHEDTVVHEKRVALPDRWIRSFGETQAILSTMEPVIETDGAEAWRFLRSLPRSTSGSDAMFLSSSGRALRLTRMASGSAVPVRGLDRLRPLDGLAREAKNVSVYRAGDGSSLWVLDLRGFRFQMLLSAEPSRGLSGEGKLLFDVADAVDPELRSQVLARLETDYVLALDTFTGESPKKIRAALAQFAASGLVGYDIATDAYYFRDLPFDVSGEDRGMPRLRSAHKLLEQGAVELPDEAGADALVAGRASDYRVREHDGSFRCSCDWFARHGADRGPCSHILAVHLALRDRDAQRG